MSCHVMKFNTFLLFEWINWQHQSKVSSRSQRELGFHSGKLARGSNFLQQTSQFLFRFTMSESSLFRSIVSAIYLHDWERFFNLKKETSERECVPFFTFPFADVAVSTCDPWDCGRYLVIISGIITDEEDRVGLWNVQFPPWSVPWGFELSSPGVSVLQAFLFCEIVNVFIVSTS